MHTASALACQPTQHNRAWGRRATQAVAAVALAMASAAACAGTVTFNGNTTGGPTWNRTLGGAPPNALSAVGTAVSFEVTPFEVSASGNYTLLNSSLHDSYLHLYKTSFDPLGQFTNVLAADDDNGPGSDSQFTIGLLSGTQYLAVSSGFANVDFGAFSLTISGLGDITRSNRQAGPIPQVPEPTSLALVGLALAGLAAHRRRVA